MAEVVICEPIRTAVGRYGGALKGLPAHELAGQAIAALVQRSGLDAADVDEVILGQCYPTMEAPAIGRVAALEAGLGVGVTGFQVDRRCGSGLQAVLTAAMEVEQGIVELAIAGGVESMSNAVHYSDQVRWGSRSGSPVLHDALARGRVTAGGSLFPVPGGMIETAENVRRDYSITRERQDAWSVRSHQRAVAAQQSGRFSDEIVAVTVPGSDEPVTQDEHPRPNVSLETLGRLRPLMNDLDPESTVTAGNASGQNDAASACIVTTRGRAEQLGLRPLARIVSWAVAGVPPATMGIGPVPSTAKALAAAGLALSDIDLIELNEAFASQVLACVDLWGLTEDDHDRVNVNGSGISLGHPVGATGGRILATLLREMDRREARYGLETMCIGGGQGMTAVFERVS